MPRGRLYWRHALTLLGVLVSIDDQLVVNNDGPHSFTQVHGDIALAAGHHAIKVEFFENWGGFDLKVLWTPPGSEAVAIPGDRLYAGQ